MFTMSFYSSQYSQKSSAGYFKALINCTPVVCDSLYELKYVNIEVLDLSNYSSIIFYACHWRGFAK